MAPLQALRFAPFLFGTVVVAMVGGVASPVAAEPQNLLAERKPIAANGVKNGARLTDGLLSNEGDEWLTDVTSRFTSSRSYVTYDLGTPQKLGCLLVQADNNDVYYMAGSLDGESWTQLWRVGADPAPGMRARTTKLDVTARYLRLSATGGDALYSVSEIAAYADCPPVPWPNDIPHAHGIPVGDSADVKVLVFGVLAGLFVLIHRRKGPNLQYVLLFPVLGSAWMMIAELVDLYPFFNQEPPLRAMAAGLAALVVIKEAFLGRRKDGTPGPGRWAPHRTVSLATLGFCAFT